MILYGLINSIVCSLGYLQLVYSKIQYILDMNKIHISVRSYV